MKLLAIENTTVLRLGMMARPQGQLYLPFAIPLVQEQFGFVGVPDTNAPRIEALEFTQGRHGDFTIGSLGIYNDGIVLKSQDNSAKLDDFLLFLENWAGQVFGVEFHPSTKTSSLYESALTVQADVGAIKAIKRWVKIEKLLSDKLRNDTGVEADATFNGISFAVAPRNLGAGAFKPAQFKFERKAGTETSVGHFFSLAPLKTDSHLELLSELLLLS